MPRKYNYQKRKEHYRLYNRQFLREWRAKGNSSPSHSKEYMREYMKVWSKLPHAIKMNRARNIVNEHIYAGKLERQPCEIVGCDTIAEAHHDDYDKPLDIKWLCKRHHEQHHTILNEMKGNI